MEYGGLHYLGMKDISILANDDTCTLTAKFIDIDSPTSYSRVPLDALIDLITDYKNRRAANADF